MAATHLAPARDLISIKEGVALLADTGHPVTRRQLSDDLAAAGIRPERRGQTYYYSASDIAEVHRDRVDRLAAAAR